MKIVGRLILLAVGITAITFGIIFIINSIDFLKNFDWTNIINNNTYINYIINLVINFVLVLFGISSCFCSLLGKMSIKWFLFSLIIIGFAIYYIISYNVNVSLQNDTFLTLSITSIVLPVGYIVGGIIVSVAN